MASLEIRGRDGHWRVYYPAEERLAYPIPVYDREGLFKGSIMAGGSTEEKLTEAHFQGTREEAVEYCRYLLPGCEVTVVRTLSKREALKKAREARGH